MRQEDPFLKTLGVLSIAPIVAGVSAEAAAKVPARQPVGKFVPVMLTPYQSNKSIDFEVLSRLVDFYEAAGARGYFANCLSSEMYHLTPEERLQVTSHVVKRVQGRFPVVASGFFGDTLEEKS